MEKNSKNQVWNFNDRIDAGVLRCGTQDFSVHG